MNAIILAGGQGSRMVASKQLIHKPLLPILGIPNIERTIIMLKDYGIDDIIIISGKYSDQYAYLHHKYNCSIISDPKTSISTLYGIYHVKNEIGDTFIIEGDVVLAENIFAYKPYSYYYVMKYPNPEPDAWKPATNITGQITSFDIGYFNEPCIFGISFWSKKDSKYIQNFINQIGTFENLHNSNKFWDDYFLDIIDTLPIYTYEIPSDTAMEMNNAYEYKLAQELCYQYYLTPNKYFLNLEDYNNYFSFEVNQEQTVIYIRKLFEDYNLKHPDHIHSIDQPIDFAPNEYSYIIKKGGQQIGVFSLVLEERSLLLRRIYIDQSHRNQLSGSKLVEKIITFSKLINKELRVNVYDEQASHFYKRLGFQINFVNYAIRSK